MESTASTSSHAEMRKIKRSPSHELQTDMQQNEGVTKFAKTAETFDSKVVLNEELYRSVREMFPRRPAKTVKRVLARYSYNEFFMNKMCDRLLRNDPDGPSDEESIVEDIAPSQANATTSNVQTEDAIATATNLIESATIPAAEKPVEFSEHEKLQRDIAEVMEFVPDCDYEHIVEKLKSLSEQPQRAQILIQDLFFNKKYPKITDLLLKKKHHETLDGFLNMPVDIEELLKVVADPFGYYGDLKREVSESYKQNCRVYLENTFSMLSSATIERLLRKFYFHLTPIVDEIDFALKCNEQKMSTASAKSLQLSPGSKKAFTKRFIRYELVDSKRLFEYPSELDNGFFRELMFAKNRSAIKTFLDNQQETRKMKLEQARASGMVFTCNICCNDDLLDDDMIQCDIFHSFCSECVKTYIRTEMGEGKVHFGCMEPKCECEYPASVLLSLLERSVSSNLFKRIQDDEVRKAGLSGLETCPFCSYAVIIENESEKVFYCQNAECMKESCRLCKEPNHIPRRCNEIEKDNEVSMRTYVENKVSEAMIRVCHKCGQRFFKEEGCNHMRCQCGAEMCYLCREPIKGTSHFHNNPKGCQQFTNSDQVHHDEMGKAYEDAVAKYKEEHPDAKDVELRYDPKKHIDDFGKKVKQLPPSFAGFQPQDTQRLIMTELTRAYYLTNMRLTGGNSTSASTSVNSVVNATTRNAYSMPGFPLPSHTIANHDVNRNLPIMFQSHFQEQIDHILRSDAATSPANLENLRALQDLLRH